jgi:hypothetical protein
MGKPDALSRWAYHSQGENNNFTPYPPSYFRSMHSQAWDLKVMSKISCENFDAVSAIINTQEKSVVKAARELRNAKGRSTVKSTVVWEWWVTLLRYCLLATLFSTQWFVTCLLNHWFKHLSVLIRVYLSLSESSKPFYLHHTYVQR